MNKKIILAVKCAPERRLFLLAKKAGIGAVELYLSGEMLKNLGSLIDTCNDFSFRYAVHAPKDYCNLSKLAELTQAIHAKVIVFHNIYWENEWDKVNKRFKNLQAVICIENIYSVHEPVKFERRYGWGGCLDLEHLQLECAGVYEDEFLSIIKKASHIHLTGYSHGSRLWHTHLHHAPRHACYMLNLLKKAGYSGFVVSEAKTSLQTYGEFKRLVKFYKKWESRQ